MDYTEALDDVRYAHHLRHRGQDNKTLALWFWVGVCCIVAVVGAGRAVAWWAGRRHSKTTKTTPRTRHLPLYLKRFIGLLRAVSLISFRRVSVGRLCVLLAYAGNVVSLLVRVHAPVFSTHFLDDVAFRAAWVTVTQVPLIYLLSTKRGPLNVVTGISYERINWLHRWTGRMLFICATAHMAIMMSSISIVELVQSPDRAMMVVRYGAGAYGTLAWIVGSSILPLRRWSYRVFHLNHWVSTLVFLGLVASHVPSYARLPIYASVAIVAMDKSLCALKLLSNNMTIRPSNRKSANYGLEYNRQVLAMGYPVKMMTPFNTNSSVCPVESATIIRISNVPFSWRPGQHVRLYIPKLGALETHPFTPATCSDVSRSPSLPTKDDDVEHHGLLDHNTASTANDLLIMIKSHSGLTKRLSDYHGEWLALPCPNASRPSSALTAYVDGPYGNLPAWEAYENIVIIASSTGVTFPLSILDYLEQLCFDAQRRPRTRQVQLVWANRHIEPQFEATICDLLARHTIVLRQSGTKVEARFYTTCREATDQQFREHDPFAHLRLSRPKYFAKRRPLRIRNPNAPLEESEEEEELWNADAEAECDVAKKPPHTREMSRRSSCESYVSSTLVDEDSDGCNLNLMTAELDSSCWTRLPSLCNWRIKRRTEPVNVCQCAYIRHEQRRLKQKPLPEYISRLYGQRPDIASILPSSIPQLRSERTMVVVCSNEGVITEATTVVSRMNLEFARGRRRAGVQIHTEGFA